MTDAPRAGRYVETDKMCLGVWKRLTQAFSVSQLILIGVIGVRSMMPFRKDNLGEMLGSSHWKIGLGLLGGLDDAQVGFLERYAEVNARRVEHNFRSWALVLVSLPVGALVAVNEILPGVFEIRDNSFFLSLVTVISFWAVVAGVMMASAWRARDLHDLLRFEQGRRALAQAQEHRTQENTA